MSVAPVFAAVFEVTLDFVFLVAQLGSLFALGRKTGQRFVQFGEATGALAFEAGFFLVEHGLERLDALVLELLQMLEAFFDGG